MSCFYKTCPCFFRRPDTQVPFAHYAPDDEGNVEFENLLAQRDPDPIAAYLDRTASSGNNAQGYLRVNPMSPFGRNGASSSRVSVVSEDEDDAVSLPDEQISKFTEQLIDEQFKTNQQADARLAAEEEEARLQEELEIERKRQAAHQKAISKGFLPPIESVRTKDTFFSIDDDDDSDEEQYNSATLGGSRTMELSTTKNKSEPRKVVEEEEQQSVLNKPRNPHQRLFNADIDYNDVREFTDEPSTYTSTPPSPKRRYSRRTRSVIRENEQKMETYSPFSAHILQDEDEYEHEHENSTSSEEHQYRYDPNAAEDEIDHPFAHILPDISGRIGAFLFGKKDEKEDEREREDIDETEGLGQVNIDIGPSVDRQFAKDIDATELGGTEEHNTTSLAVPRNENDKSRSRSSSFRRFVEGVTSVFDADVDI